MKKFMLIAIGFLFAGSISAHGFHEERRECRERYIEPNHCERVVVIQRPAPYFIAQPYGYRHERHRECERREHRCYQRDFYYR